MATAILAYGWWADQRVADCRKGEVPGGDSWNACANAGDFNG